MTIVQTLLLILLGMGIGMLTLAILFVIGFMNTWR